MLKRILSLILVVSYALSLTACADNKRINGVMYETYGFLNKEEVRNPNISYEASIGNVIWGIIFSETLIAPIYFFGFSLYEPVGPKVLPTSSQNDR